MEDSRHSTTDPDVDSWYGVDCPRARKRIQDRLAQRARRKLVPHFDLIMDGDTYCENICTQARG